MDETKQKMAKWNIKLYECPSTMKVIKNFITEKFRIAMWTNHKGCKKDHCIKEFNSNCDHGEKVYLGAAVKGKATLM